MICSRRNGSGISKAVLPAPGGYKERSGFLSNCIASAKDGVGEEKAKTYCECMLYKIEIRYPDPADADKLTAEKLSSPEWKKIIQGCLDF